MHVQYGQFISILQLFTALIVRAYRQQATRVLTNLVTETARAQQHIVMDKPECYQATPT